MAYCDRLRGCAFCCSIVSVYLLNCHHSIASRRFPLPSIACFSWVTITVAVAVIDILMHFPTFLSFHILVELHFGLARIRYRRCRSQLPSRCTPRLLCVVCLLCCAVPNCAVLRRCGCDPMQFCEVVGVADFGHFALLRERFRFRFRLSLEYFLALFSIVSFPLHCFPFVSFAAMVGTQANRHL